MKYVTTVVGILLGLLFIASGITVLFNLVPIPAIPEGTPAAHFFAAFGPTGYLTLVKVLEVPGGILVAIPRTRNCGLLVLGPIIVNILAFHLFVTHDGLFSPTVLFVALAALYLLWAGRKAFAGLVTQAS